MKTQNYELLNDQITSTLTNLKVLDHNSEEYKMEIRYLETLYRIRLDIQKTDIEAEEKKFKREMEEKYRGLDLELKEKQIAHDMDNMEHERIFKNLRADNQQIHEYIKTGIEVAGLILPLMFYNTWMKKGLKFEETGTFTSSTFRGLFQKFKPTK